MADFLEALARTRVNDVLDFASSCPGCCAASSSVSIAEVDERQKLNVVHDLDLEDFEEYLTQAGSDSDDDSDEDDDDDDSLVSTHMSGPRRLRLIWLAESTEDGCESETHMHLEPALMRLLHQSAGMSSRFLVDVLETPAWAGLPTDTLSTGPQLPFQGIHYSFFPGGIATPPCFTHIVAERTRVTYFCVNHPKAIRERICKSLKESPSLAAQPFLVDVLITIELLAMRRETIMRLRSDPIQHSPPSSNTGLEERQFESQLRGLRELALRWQTMLTDLAGIERHISALRVVAAPTPRISAVLSTQNAGVHSHLNGPLASAAADKALELVEASCGFLARWAAMYHEQTCSWMTMVKAEMALEESRLKQQRKDSAADVTLQAQRDGVRLLTLAVMMIAMIIALIVVVTGLLGFMFVTSGYARFTVPHLWWAVPFTAVTSVIFAPVCVWLLWSPGAKWLSLRGQLAPVVGGSPKQEEDTGQEHKLKGILRK